jgi:2-polyprenyl-3-methyl-5-hydroxy-6-metoxy-1,4-benzoquinol methylase
MTRRPELLTTCGGGLCPVCKAEASRAASFEDYQLYRCRTCECWSSDALNRGAATSFEPANYFENAELDRPKWSSLVESILARGRSVDSVLDVGCGTGAFLSWITKAHQPTRCEGIELDDGRAKQAQEHNPGAEIHLGDAVEVLSKSSSKFELITLWDVFEHVTDPVGLLVHLAQHLEPGGCIHIVTIHEQSLLPRVGRAIYKATAGQFAYPMRRTHEAHHLVFFSRKGLTLAAQEAGLSIRDLWFDRLRRGRMDGHPLVTGTAAALLRLENAFGNGIFINLVLELD